MLQLAHILAKNGEKGLLHLAASDESDLSDLSDTNLLTRYLVDSLTSPWGGGQKKVGHS